MSNSSSNGSSNSGSLLVVVVVFTPRAIETYTSSVWGKDRIISPC